MKKKFEIIGLCLGWFAVLAQFVLMFQNRTTDIPEMVLRFFSFFTILTNILVALYLTASAYGLKMFPFGQIKSKGSLTAITAFIFVVGLVYQVALRGIWQPTGLQWVVDELLHTIIPLFMLGYWYFNIKKEELHIKSVFKWLLYPVIYIVFILLRGYFSGFYPYPFLNVKEIGTGQAVINIGIILIIMLITIMVLIIAGRKLSKQ